ncbi:MAG TPA: hypothetical protein VE076_09620 [Nitrososphaeraceae archaeon]|nr:hypothetical protein [Nitrososphaeraceae archaeon]
MNVLEDKQRRNFKQLSMSPGIWDYVSNNKGKIYNLYGNAKAVHTDNNNKNKN